MLLLVASTLDSSDGGISRSAPFLACAVHQAGMPVEMIGRRFSGPATIDPSLEDFPVTILPGGGKGIRRALPDLAFRAFLKHRVETLMAEGDVVLHHPGIWTDVNYYVSALALSKGIPVVCSPRGMLEAWSLNYHRRRKQLAWQLYAHKMLRATTVFHATAPSEAEAIRNLGFKQPIAIVPNGVELPDMASKPKERRLRRRALFLSRIHQKKGLLNLIEAWAQIRPAGWELVIAGPDDGGHKSSVEEAVAQCDLQSEVSFLPSVDGEAKWDLYRSADLFVLPTLSENFGIVVAEALGCGVPVLTTKGAPWEELVDNDCGWWIDLGIEPLVRGLQEAMQVSDDERQEKGRRGRNLVMDRYTWPKIGERMKKIYEWMLLGGPPPHDVYIDTV